MANEQVPSSITDLVAGEVLAAEYLMLLADRDGSVLNHPAFFHATGRPGSNVVRVPHLGIGYDLLTADTPGAEHANTAFSDNHTDVTLANYVLRYTNHDLARWMADGKLDPAIFAQGAAISVSQTLISLAANVGDGFTNIAGTSTVDATWDDVQTAKAFLLNAKASGSICAIVAPQQWADLEADALALGVLPAGSMASVITTGLDSYKGRYMGIDFFVSGAVPATGGNSLGCIFTSGGIVWADAEYAPSASKYADIVNLGRGQLELVRQGTSSADSYIIRAMMGVSLGIDAAGVTFRTDQ